MCHLGILKAILDSLSFSQPHSQLPTLVPTICTKNTSLTLPSPIFAQKNFTHSFWLHLMMEAILNSAILDSATTILNSETLLFSLRVTQKHSHSTLTLTQTNSICLKLIHSHLTWWWQPLWIVPSWIQPFCTKRTSPHSQKNFICPQPLHIKKLHSFIVTQLDDGSHLEFCHVGFRHCHLGFRHLVIFSQIHSKTVSLHSDSDSC